MAQVRRVVTGHSVAGKAVVASDARVEGVSPLLDPASEHHLLWGADALPTFPDDGSKPPASGYFPPVGGVRFLIFTVAPGTTERPKDLDMQLAVRDLEDKLPGVLAHLEPGQPGMHKTASVDFEYVISGEVWLELDDGVEVHLKAGDTVVQNGTRHAWRNKSSGPCRIAVVLVGVPHRALNLRSVA